MKPRVALLRGHVASPYELQAYELLRRDFDLTLFSPHLTRVDLAGVDLPRRTLYCPVEGHDAFEGKRREFQALREAWTRGTHSFCGLADLLAGYDILHVADTYYCFSLEAVLAKRRFGGKIAVTHWENIPHLSRQRWSTRVVSARVREQADLFLAVSEGAREALREEGVEEGRIMTCAPGVDVRHFTPGARDAALWERHRIPRGAWVLLFAGRHVPEKGVFTLLAAARELKDAMPDLYLLMVGRDERDAEGWARRRGLDGFVRFAGFVGYEEMPAYYRSSHVFLLPSEEVKGWKEQFGFVLAEAMACGVPVVGAASGAIPEVVGDAGLLFKPGSAPDLVRAVREARRSSRVLAVRGLRRARRKFSRESAARAIAAAYHRLLA